MEYERVKAEALKHTSRSKFRIRSSGAYNTACKNGWLEDVCSHMNRKIRPKGHWTYERVKAEALKHTSRSEFWVCGGGAYDAACKNDWLEDVCSHMSQKNRPKGYWTYERVQAEAQKHTSRLKFRVCSGGAYDAAKRNDWLEDVCSHMGRKSNPPGYWTYERVKAEALKYNTREEFKKNSGGAYSATYYHDWQNEICAHMKDCRIKGSF